MTTTIAGATTTAKRTAAKGTRQFKICLTDMAAGLAPQLRVFLLLILFSLGASGHAVAMGTGPMSADMAPIAAAAMPMQMAVGESHDANCPGHHCDSRAPSCCLMGQCLLGVAPASPPAFLPTAKAEPVAGPMMVPTAPIIFRPFRPPAVV